MIERMENSKNKLAENFLPNRGTRPITIYRNHYFDASYEWILYAILPFTFLMNFMLRLPFHGISFSTWKIS